MTTQVYLSGGLGNQLFQLAAALFVSKGESIVLESRYAHTRLNIKGNPDICGFQLPSNVSASSVECQPMLRRVMNLSLRLGAQNSPKILIQALQILISWMFLIFERKFVRVFINIGVGYDPRIEKCPQNTFLVGYFQTHKLVDKFEVNKVMNSLLLTPGHSVDSLPIPEDEAIYVHMRLGDYVEAESFGIPNIDYYRGGISQLRQFKSKLKLIVFSDDPVGAKKRLEDLLCDDDFVLAQTEKSASEVLQSLRSGKYFIIGNSTFSWWGAYLSSNKGKKIVCPRPWFKVAQCPQEIVPENWIQVEAF